MRRFGRTRATGRAMTWSSWARQSRSKSIWIKSSSGSKARAMRLWRDRSAKSAFLPQTIYSRSTPARKLIWAAGCKAPRSTATATSVCNTWRGGHQLAHAGRNLSPDADVPRSFDYTVYGLRTIGAVSAGCDGIGIRRRRAIDAAVPSRRLGYHRGICFHEESQGSRPFSSAVADPVRRKRFLGADLRDRVVSTSSARDWVDRGFARYPARHVHGRPVPGQHRSATVPLGAAASAEDLRLPRKPDRHLWSPGVVRNPSC